MNNYPHIDIIKPNDTEVFTEQYLHKKPVLVKGYFKDSRAVKLWDEKYFLNLAGNTRVEVTKSKGNEYERTSMQLVDYLQWIITDQNRELAPESTLEKENYYLHNFHLETIRADLLNDLDFNLEVFIGKWYLENWKKSLSIFYGNKNIINPLHYDALGAHNTFLQVKGHKKFILIPKDQVAYCYTTIKNSNGSKVDLENLDYQKYPLFAKTTPFEANLEGGDILYVPPYTLHHVKGIDLNISVKVDWHTTQSVINAFFSGQSFPQTKKFRFRYWNTIFFLGVCCGIPNSILFPFFKSYYKT